MINKATQTLHIFDADIIIDHTLLKYSKRGIGGVNPVSLSNMGDPVVFIDGNMVSGNQMHYWDGLNITTQNSLRRQLIANAVEELEMVKNSPRYRLSWLLRLKVAGLRWLLRKYLYTPISVQDFFVRTIQSHTQLLAIEERIESYQDAINRAEVNGQRALAEKLNRLLAVVAAESRLYALGDDFRKVILEEQLVKFVQQCPRGLRLDYVANFTRVIPNDVLAAKRMADNHEVFDNYLVLHYDPDNKSSELTEAQKAAKKDPILFGVIRGSRKLYYLGDWIDEYCDLTLKDLVKVIGKKEVDNNQLTKNINLNGLTSKR